MVFETKIRVRYSETDKMGVVYHANYLMYFEVARTALLHELGYPYEEVEKKGYLSPVVDVHLHYGAPLQFGDVAVVRTRITKLTQTKTIFEYEIYKEGQDFETERPCVTGETTLGLVDGSSFKSVSMKRAIPELYEMYQRALEKE